MGRILNPLSDLSPFLTEEQDNFTEAVLKIGDMDAVQVNPTNHALILGPDALPTDLEAWSQSELPTFSPNEPFWEQYLRFQHFAELVEKQGARVNVAVTNNLTGESMQFENLALKVTHTSH